MSGTPPLDRFGRRHDDLRISVTDRCNLRCTYCMPEDPDWFPRAAILRYEEIARLTRLFLGLGVRTVRLTGGEPLVRRDLPDLVAMLAGLPGLEDLSLTTNAVLLERAAPALVRAGLRRINVSLDTLHPERFERLTGRAHLPAVLRGLDAAVRAGLGPIKLNAVVLRGINDDEVEELVGFARARGFEMRFIECMPLGNDGSWDPSRVVPGASVRARVHALWPIEPAPDRSAPSAPATRYRFLDGSGHVGFIDSVTHPFCGACSRLRLTSDGMLRVCLYDDRETDLKTRLRSGADDDELAAIVRAAVWEKGRGGALDLLERQSAAPLARTMHQIGG